MNYSKINSPDGIIEDDVGHLCNAAMYVATYIGGIRLFSQSECFGIDMVLFLTSPDGCVF